MSDVQTTTFLPDSILQADDLPTIPGVVPPPWEWPEHCHFAGRCAYTTDACTEGPVAMRPSALSLARCVRAAELDLTGVRDLNGDGAP